MDELEFFLNQLKEDDFGVKLQAIHMLGEFQDKRATKPLLELYGDKDWQIRNAAVEAICKIKDPDAIPILTEFLRNDDANIRNAAMQTLEKLGEDVVPPLLEALKDEDEDVRIFACNTLGNLGEKRAVEGLIEALDDSNENVYYAAAEALGRIKDKRAVPALLKKLEEKDIWDRFVLITALGEIGDELAVSPLINQLKIEELKGVTIEALGKIGFEESIPYIVKELNTSDDEDIKFEALKAIFNIAQKTYQFARLEKNKFLQDFIVSSLKSIDFKKLHNEIEKIVNSDDTELKFKILQILDWTGTTIPVNLIIPLLKIEELEDLAYELLIKLSYENPKSLVDAFNKEEDIYTKSFIIKALGYSTDDDSEKFLKELLDSEEPEIVIAASEALVLSFADLDAEEGFIDKLIMMLQTEDEDIKESAERVLVILAHNEKILNKISQLLFSKNINAITSVIKILSISNNSDYIENILNFIEHESPLIRKEVYKAINYLAKVEFNRNQIINSDFYEKILLGVYDTDDEVKIEAIYALGSLQEDKAYETLKNILFDPALQALKPYIVRSIKNYYKKELKDIFMEILNDEITDIETKLIIIQTLRVIGDKDVIEPISDLLFEIEEDDIKSEIILTIGELGSQEILDYLIPFLEDENWLLKNSAILAMEKIISPDVKNEVLRVLKDSKGIEAEYIIKNSCIKVLKNYPEVSVLQTIIPRLMESDVAYETFNAIESMLKKNEELKNEVLEIIKKTEEAKIQRLLISILKELSIKIELDYFKELYYKTQYTSIKMIILKYFHAIEENYKEICEKEQNKFLCTLCKWFETNEITLEC